MVAYKSAILLTVVILLVLPLSPARETSDAAVEDKCHLQNIKIIAQLQAFDFSGHGGPRATMWPNRPFFCLVQNRTGREPSQRIIVKKALHNCTCDLGDGLTGTYPDGTECLVRDRGYNGELNLKAGKCKDGKCVYTVMARGCTAMAKEGKVPDGLQVGCAYICDKGTGTGKEFNYYSEGISCVHLEGEQRLNGTCKKVKMEILCIPKKLA
uniref:Putative secreted protein n=1 Tax=Amblyomma triste TaxID=251400 RepID=A0A023GE56_AMBTT